jgi:hypothetical protein
MSSDFLCKRNAVDSFIDRSFLMRLFKEEREEILRHKWVLSEQAGHDVGYEVALFSWLRNHRQKWLESQLKNKPPSIFG